MALKELEHLSTSAVETHQYTSVEQVIDKVKGVANLEISSLFASCIHDTFNNIKHPGYIITGDINAMWLRDSTIQILPYLELVNGDNKLRQLPLDLINQQARFILEDVYANAWKKENEKEKPKIHERKWEPDSLASFIFLSYKYREITGSGSFTHNPLWQEAAKKVYSTFREQQRLNGNGSYAWKPETLLQKILMSERVHNLGFGRKTNKIGLIHSTHRPSDDACAYPFNIPQNLFAKRALTQIAEIFEEEHLGNKELIEGCREFAQTIENAVREHGVFHHPKFGDIFAYETNGLGQFEIIDDANIPGLLSLPFFEAIDVNDPVYQNTRRFVMSPKNKYFYNGIKIQKDGSKRGYAGIGSLHTRRPFDKMIWPISVIIQALTSRDNDEISECLRMLKKMHGGRYLFNETVGKNNPQKYTRKYFGMANSLFAELILRLYEDPSKQNLLSK